MHYETRRSNPTMTIKVTTYIGMNYELLLLKSEYIVTFAIGKK